MTAKRWQIVGGYGFAIINVTILDAFTSPHEIWSWGTLLSVAVFVLSYQTGGYVVRQWQAAGPNRGRRFNDK